MNVDKNLIGKKVEQVIDEKKLIEDIKSKYCDLDFMDDGVIQLFVDEINKQPKADWIPCEVEMPKEEMEVWVTHENGKVLRHYWYNGEFVQNYPLDEPRPYPKAIAWMPCIKPQPYKKEGAE